MLFFHVTLFSFSRPLASRFSFLSANRSLTDGCLLAFHAVAPQKGYWTGIILFKFQMFPRFFEIGN